MPRLFTGLELPEDIAFQLNIMQGGVRGARWIEASDYHITLRFIGDIEERVARDIRLSLQTVAAQPFKIQLKGVGTFGGNDPHTIFTAVAESADLRRLQASHERHCKLAGLPAEGRRFMPHVTLARLRSPDVPEVQQFIARQNLFVSRPFDVSHFVLFSSRPSRGGGPYGVVDTFSLRSLAL